MFSIRAIEIENFKKIQTKLRIDGLGSGLNVIAGDNEDGKSTLFEAIRAVLFEKHTTRSAQKYQPYGSAVRPNVSIEFNVDGKAYKIFKAFCQKPEAVLETETCAFSGSSAEELLQNWLGYEAPTRGESQEKHQGMHGLLWVQQGHAHSLSHTLTSRQTLNSTLEAEVGDVLGGGLGDLLLEKVNKEYALYFGKNNKPVKQYREAEQTVAELNEKVTVAEEKLAQYEAKVEHLSRLQRKLNKFQDDDTLCHLEKAFQQAEHDFLQAERLTRQCHQAEQHCEVLRAQIEIPKQQWKHRLVNQQKLDENRSTTKINQESLAALESKAKKLQTTVNEVAGKRKQTSEKQQRLEKSLNQVRAQLAIAEHLDDAKVLESALTQAQDIATDLEAKRKTLLETQVPRVIVDDAEQLEQQIMRAEAKLSVTASKIEIDLNQHVIIDKQLFTGKKTLDVVRTVVIDIPDVGRIAITPGTGAHAELNEDVTRWKQQLEDITDQYSCHDVIELKEKLQTCETLQHEIKQQEKLLLAHAPEGIAKLKQKIEQLRAEVQLLNRPHQFTLPIDINATKQTLNKLLSDKSAVDSDLAKLNEEHDKWHEQLALVSQDFHQLKAKQDAASESIKRLENELFEMRAEMPDQKLFQKLELLKQELILAEGKAAEARSAIDTITQEDLASRKEMTERALINTKQQIETLEKEIHGLKIELRTEGQSGLGEEVEQYKSQLSFAQSVYRTLDKTAQSTRLLKSILEKHASAAKQNFLAPVRNRMMPYINSLMPDSELIFDDDFELTGIKRRQSEEPFNALSRGTQEQLAILVRLAFADILAEQQHPVSVLLDDALAYSDTDRLERMKLILHRAAQRYQILVLTCRESDYLSLGAPTHYINQLAQI